MTSVLIPTTAGSPYAAKENKPFNNQQTSITGRPKAPIPHAIETEQCH
jgi:hypothetical protein